MPPFEIIDVNAKNVDQVGFFCAMSRPDLIGYEDKLVWLESRFRQGLRLKMILKGGRGFIEYIPGKYAWRGIVAPNYMVVHCLWVVGRAKGHGCGEALLDECIRDARDANLDGVAAVTAHKRIWHSETGYFLHRGFKLIDTAPPGADLVALKFRRAPDPAFTGDWEKKRRKLGSGLTVVSSAQCPYSYEGAQQIAQAARLLGLPAATVRLKTAADVRRSAPTPCGVFDIVYNGQIIPNLCHHISAAKLRTMLDRSQASARRLSRALV
ncbi:MAG: hypothetical protein ABSF23_09405 [Terracidiphilus sp.]|jgi:L-amino acid N-acyltransferase YncA